MSAGPCIICVAITGSLPQKSDSPAVPIAVAEQVESTQEAFKAGTAIAPCHARTGLEDNIRLDRHTLALLNAALVRRTVGIATRHHRPVAIPANARALLGLPATA